MEHKPEDGAAPAPPAEFIPLCPHCEAEVMNFNILNASSAGLMAFACPHCKKIISVQSVRVSLNVPGRPEQQKPPLIIPGNKRFGR